MLAEAKGANCDGVLSVQLVPGTPADRVGIAQFTLLDVKQLVSAAAIDSAALAAGRARARCPRAARRNSSPVARADAPQLCSDGRRAHRCHLPDFLKRVAGTYRPRCH